MDDTAPRGARRTTLAMDTFVTIHIAAHAEDDEAEAAIERALAWFRDVESCCSRFSPRSELAALTRRPGEDVPVSTMLFEALRFALALAGETAGAFDPTVGRRMEALGFNREYRTGVIIETPGEPVPGTFRDVHVDPDRRTVRLDRPVVLDLGAVAKGLAIDLAAQELAPFEDYAIDAGGDLYLAGRSPTGDDWSVGIRDPRVEGRLVDILRVSDRAVCTSGDYERGRRGDASPHILDPRTGAAADDVASVTVVGRPAMLADGLATAAFVLGPRQGIDLLERHGVQGLIVSTTLERYETSGGVA